jgi:hypothetical protein
MSEYHRHRVPPDSEFSIIAYLVSFHDSNVPIADASQSLPMPRFTSSMLMPPRMHRGRGHACPSIWSLLHLPMCVNSMSANTCSPRDQRCICMTERPASEVKISLQFKKSLSAVWMENGKVDYTRRRRRSVRGENIAPERPMAISMSISIRNPMGTEEMQRSGPNLEFSRWHQRS